MVAPRSRMQSIKPTLEAASVLYCVFSRPKASNRETGRDLGVEGLTRSVDWSQCVDLRELAFDCVHERGAIHFLPICLSLLGNVLPAPFFCRETASAFPSVFSRPKASIRETGRYLSLEKREMEPVRSVVWSQSVVVRELEPWIAGSSEVPAHFLCVCLSLLENVLPAALLHREAASAFPFVF